MKPFEDRRTDPAMRAMFVRAHELVKPFISPDGGFLTLAHEHQATQALQNEFPDLEASRLFALLAYTRSVCASGRKPVS